MSYSVANVEDKPKTRDEYIKELVRSLTILDQAIEPFKEQKKDLKKNYVENGWLTKEEMRYIVKSYTLAKNSDFDIDAFVEIFSKVKK